MFTDLPYTPVVPYEASGSDNLHTLSVGGWRNSFRVDKQGLSLGSKDFKTAPFRSDMDGNVTMNNADIRGTISGRHTDTIAKVITANGNIVTEKMDFEAGKILKEFTFAGYEGAFKSGGIKWDKDNGNITAGSGVVMNQNGIIGARNGRTTFAINNNGDATFSGTLTAPSGTLWNITAGNLQGTTIQGSTITGSTLKTADSGERVEITRQNILSYWRNGKRRFQTSSTGVRLLDNTEEFASDIFVEGTDRSHGTEMPRLRITGKIVGDIVACDYVYPIGIQFPDGTIMRTAPTTPDTSQFLTFVADLGSSIQVANNGKVYRLNKF